MRVTHRLSRNAEQSTPSLRIFLDTECRTEIAADGTQVQTLRFGWALRERQSVSHGRKATTQRWQRFETPDQAWDMIEKSALIGQLCHVYAHNWDYDAAMIAMDSQAQARGWACTRWARGKHFLFARFQKGKRAILFVDTLNYWSGSVETLGESLGFAKYPVPHLTHSIEQWDTYCKRDVQIIATFMHGLYDLATAQGWGRFKPTLAGMAWHAFRHKFMTVAPLVIADDRLSAFERKSYHGGRTECFRIGRVEGPIYQLDVNSMYPAVMRDHAYPLAKLRWGHAMTVDAYRQLRKRFLAIADCAIETDEPVYPVRHDGRLIFPVGMFDTTLCTPEIDYAADHGHLITLRDATLYSQSHLFTSYADSLHALRMEYAARLNRPIELACKLMLNSLYGKFGQIALRWEKCPLGYGHTEKEFMFACSRGGPTMRHDVRWGVVWHQVREGESQESIPSIAAHVTAYARMRLWHLMCLAGRENVYYVDTDSVFVNQLGRDRLELLINGNKLGKLKVAGCYEWAHFHGPKDYETDQGVCIKGIRHSAARVAANAYAQDRFTSYDQMLKEGIDGEIHVRTECKVLARQYTKGLAHPDGTVEPLRLPAN